jgi:ATP-dependent Clp protease adaptor protein ClpS
MSTTNIQTISQKQEIVITPPQKYHVILLNDDFTPMDFVVKILMDIFHFSHTQATAVMLMVHETGRGVCGVYQKDVAETKQRQVIARARTAEHPLQCVIMPV